MTKLAIENTRINDPAKAIGVFNMLMKALKPPTSWFHGKTQIKLDAVGMKKSPKCC
jgi:hypothetical protein